MEIKQPREMGPQEANELLIRLASRDSSSFDPYALVRTQYL